MKWGVSLLIFFACCNINAQCTVSDFIVENYTFDAKILLLRVIQSNPDDPDYNNPYIDESRLVPYFEKLSALYENTIEEPMLDSLFGPLQIHVNPEYLHHVYYNRTIMVASKAGSWAEQFLETGVSGVPEFDALIDTYNLFEVGGFVTSSGTLFLWLESSDEALNMLPVVAEFNALDIIDIAEPDTNIEDRFNYTGVPFNFEGGPMAEACDIKIFGDNVRFYIYGGDCPAGCIYELRWTFSVNDSCEVTYLSVPEFDSSQIRLYPNPTHDFIYIDNANFIEQLSLFTISGRRIHIPAWDSSPLDVSSLAPGTYILQITDQFGQTVTKSVIKH